MWRVRRSPRSSMVHLRKTLLRKVLVGTVSMIPRDHIPDLHFVIVGDLSFGDGDLNLVMVLPTLIKSNKFPLKSPRRKEVFQCQKLKCSQSVRSNNGYPISLKVACVLSSVRDLFCIFWG